VNDKKYKLIRLFDYAGVSIMLFPTKLIGIHLGLLRFVLTTYDKALQCFGPFPGGPKGILKS
jgi:hypothetical protein